ncbi:hypothetical protein [Parafilimonas sp.]|jgi:hypothetical protein
MKYLLILVNCAVSLIGKVQPKKANAIIVKGVTYKEAINALLTAEGNIA